MNKTMTKATKDAILLDTRKSILAAYECQLNVLQSEIPEVKKAYEELMAAFVNFKKVVNEAPES